MSKGKQDKKKDSDVEEIEVPTLTQDPKPVAKELPPLGPGQAYFEAPDGTIIIGEDEKDHIWYRGLNGGKGGWINKKR